MKFFFSLTGLILTLSLYSQGRPQTTSIEGKVLKASERAAYGITVTLSDIKGNIISSDSTDRKGLFRVKTLEPGPFWLDFKSPEIRLARHFILPDEGTESFLTATMVNTGEEDSAKTITLSFTKRELTEFTRIHKETSNAITRFYQAILKHSNSGSENLDGFKPVDYTEKIKEIHHHITGEKDPIVKSALYVQYLALEGMKSIIQTSDITKVLSIDLDPELVKKAYERIPPTSRLWAIEPHALEAILRIEPESYPQYKRYFGQMIQNNPYEHVRTNALFKLARFTKNNGIEADFANYFGELISSYPESNEAFRAKALFKMASGLTAGNPAPDFKINDLDNPDELISKASLLGKVYLLEFWGLGCKGCIMELPKLHKTYKKFKDRGFEILSVSLDGERFIEATQNFRQNKYPMPWVNGFAKEKFSSPIAKAYEVYAIPSPYLIDEQGNILARGNELRGDRLMAILSEYFKQQK